MANIKQQIKRIKTNEKAHLRNQAFKSSVKTIEKKLIAAVEANDKELANKTLVLAYQKLDKAQSKGIYHKNYVARHKSSLALRVNSLSK